MKVEDEYLDVLQNIEFGIINVYQKDSSLLDYDVLDALEALTRYYRAEEGHRSPPSLRLSEKAQKVFDAVKTMCEWRLGREKFVNKSGKEEDLGPEPLTLSEIQMCLKRIHKSVQKWNKGGGRRGYLNFVSQLIR